MKTTLFFFAFICTLNLFAQEEGAIRGTIYDMEMNNEPLLFADVQIKGTKFKTQTNFRGNFEISNVEPGSYILKVSFLGYEAYEVPVEVLASNTLEITQGLQAQTLDLSNMSFADEDILKNNETALTSLDK
ncbi:carboxypeptidase-like regulatory domain-containing protein [Zobellia amurskyensis]|uniref:Carboxypeptidase-like regulatory domain-containing protein n=1 Tax=Zobellia amurskyensis TaxID=248905 RepID=A0A7X3D386_9FLAO|nr:carboxypeptidase-like regulatory domain-containing protein [Zobellia amurskyensis]MUH37251.1 carboxypeptidase-like regulatory domain-containing protein [Zobellia amurskyensis]